MKMLTKKADMNQHTCIYRIMLIILALLIFSGTHGASAFPGQDKKVLKWSDNKIVILLSDHLNLPEMFWPCTLLEYPVDLSSSAVLPEELQLVERFSGLSIPFQLTKAERKNGKITSAVLCFFSDLPSGAKKEFILSGKNTFPGLAEQKLPGTVSVSPQNKQILVSNGRVDIRILAPGEYRELYPPILEIGNYGVRKGHSVMPSNLHLIKMVVSELEKGKLLADYLIDYQFEGGKDFKIKMRLAAGMDFLETEESMTGFADADSLSWKLVWDKFDPEVRYCPNRPGSPIDKTGKGYSNFAWEPVSGSEGDPLASRHPERPYDQKNLVDGKLPFKITPYHNWMTWWRTTTSAFWNEKTGQTVGLFIKDFEKWVDPAYPIWGSKDNLSVHFYYKDGFSWEMPLVEGKRSLGIALYDHQKDVRTVDKSNKPFVYIDYLRRWYGWISLDKTKDWILDYPSGKPAHPSFFSLPAQEAKFNPRDLLQDLKRTVGQMAEAGERGQGPTPVGTRTFYDHIAPLFENVEKTLTETEYRQARALFLFMTYVFMDESLMPMRNMLSGHPNFLADIKGVPGLAAFLFPDHPQAREMADHFEKSIALNLRYHTRPDEPAWEAKGGRWTENLSCYTWAFLRPTLKTSYLLHYYYDGKNRMLQPNISLYGDWLLGSLTSPLDHEKGKRTYPPQGAHSRVLTPSNLLFTLGQELWYYDPLLAEHLFWVTSPDDHGFESKPGRPDAWDSPVKDLFKNPGGTNPHLKSAKYTGYGFNLRQNFGKSDEMYVHLQQIDDGPNYRWGRAAKGGNGIIYYYANGKQYSHNGVEDVGDAPFGDTERCTNFGVKKEKSYRCIGDYRSVGRNDLTDPLYDFGFAQFASIQANGEASPEYNSRSVLMSGNDYILIFDDVRDNSVEGRLSWFVGKEDDFPSIQQIKPGVPGAEAKIELSNTPYHKDGEELPTKGRYYDGKGDFLTLVTHREKISAVEEDQAFRINKPDGSTDLVFRDDHSLNFDKNELIFEGTAGLIHQSADKKSTEAALFQGRKIGIPGISAELVGSSQYAGMSLRNSTSGFTGIIQGRGESVIRFSLKSPVKNLFFYLDGVEMALVKSGENSYTFRVPAGIHQWQWTSEGLIPEAAEIITSVTGPDWCWLNWKPVTGAVSYSIEKSVDGGVNWTLSAKNIRNTNYKLTGLKAEKKVHVRVRTVGTGGIGEPSGDYPVYPGNTKPHAPEGLTAVKTGNEVNLSWGQVLGADQYVLYQREKGSSAFKKIYSGSARSASVKTIGEILEFAVTASNGNGESPMSIIADTDESRLINWYPVPGEIFRRDTESQENGYEEYNHWIEQEMPVLTYPFQER